MNPSMVTPLPRSMKLIFTLLIILIGVVYLMNTLTPLHLHVDSIRYFNIKDCLENNCPPDSFASTDYLPIGFTTLILMLSKAGILNAPVIVIVNSIFLLGCLLFLTSILRTIVSPVLLILLTVVNWTVIKFAAHPLSEMQYLFFSCGTLYFFSLFLKKDNYLYLALAFVFCLITILTRTVGIALLPALLAGLFWHLRVRLKDSVDGNKFIFAAAIALVVLLLFFFKEELKIIDYMNNVRQFFKGGVLRFFTTNTTYHATELAEVTLNLPSNEITGYLPARGNYLYIGGGIMLVFWFLYLLLRKSSMPVYIRVYLGFYMLIILNWPYYDPRFWVPVVPLLVALVLTFNFNRGSLFKLPAQAFMIFYIAVGLLAAAYSLYTGLNKERFAVTQAKGAYRNEYETHFFGKPLSDTARHINTNVLNILQKHD